MGFVIAFPPLASKREREREQVGKKRSPESKKESKSWKKKGFDLFLTFH